MHKRNKISYETYLQVFDQHRSGEGGSHLKVKSGAEELLVSIPTSVMYRLYRLGQAYGLRQFRYFESEANIVVGQSELEEFTKYLEKILRLVNDEVLHKHVKHLIDAIESLPASPTKHVAVSVGNYFA